MFPNFELQKSSLLFHGAGSAPVPPDWLLVLAPYGGSYPLLRLGFTRSARREEGMRWGGVGREFSGKKSRGEVHLALQANDLRKGNVYFVP